MKILQTLLSSSENSTFSREAKDSVKNNHESKPMIAPVCPPVQPMPITTPLLG